jgi:hypothetical protein
MGFERYEGIVMRQLPEGEGEFAQCYAASENVSVRNVCWGDYAGVMALTVTPADMYTFDLREGIFSSKYAAPDRFLSVFPKMLSTLEKRGGLGNVLVSEESKTIVGIARAYKGSETDVDGTELEFFAHDNFLRQAGKLVRQTIEESRAEKITCQCLAEDSSKRGVIESAGGRVARILRQKTQVGNKLRDVAVYEISGPRGGR